jgi:hypothetical protein
LTAGAGADAQMAALAARADRARFLLASAAELAGEQAGTARSLSQVQELLASLQLWVTTEYSSMQEVVEAQHGLEEEYTPVMRCEAAGQARDPPCVDAGHPLPSRATSVCPSAPLPPAPPAAPAKQPSANHPPTVCQPPANQPALALCRYKPRFDHGLRILRALRRHVELFDALKGAAQRELTAIKAEAARDARPSAAELAAARRRARQESVQARLESVSGARGAGRPVSFCLGAICQLRGGKGAVYGDRAAWQQRVSAGV